MTDGQPQLQMELSPELSGGVWANMAAVSHSPYEFTIDFARMDYARATGDTIPATVVARVNLSPLMVTQLMDALRDNWQTYAEKAMPNEVRGD